MARRHDAAGTLDEQLGIPRQAYPGVAREVMIFPFCKRYHHALMIVRHGSNCPPCADPWFIFDHGQGGCAPRATDGRQVRGGQHVGLEGTGLDVYDGLIQCQRRSPLEPAMPWRPP